MATNTTLKQKYEAVLREYNCCKSLVSLYPSQYSKPLEKAKKELEAIKEEMRITATANIIAAAVEKATENQKKKDSAAEPVKVEKKQEKKESKKDSSEPVVEKKQEKKEEKKESESKKDSNSHKEVTEEQQPKEEIKAAKELISSDTVEEKGKVEEAYLKKHDPKPWKQYSLFTDEQMLDTVKGAIKSIIPLEEYSRPQLDTLLWYVSRNGNDENRTLHVPKLTISVKNALKSSKYSFDDFDLAIREKDHWVYLSSEIKDGEINQLNVEIPKKQEKKKEVKIIAEDDAQAQVEQTTQPLTVPEDSINPFLALQNNPGRLIPGYSSR